MRSSVAAAVALTGTCLLGAAAIPAVPANAVPASGPVRAAAAATRGRAGFDEHRYRVIGKVRLLLFWASRDDVGSARMTARSDGTRHTLTFLVGSEPQRAPRNLNEWSYLREEVQTAHADVFALRSLDSLDEEARAAQAAADAQVFDVSCSSMGADAVHSVKTRVNARGVTYRMFDRVLDQIAASPRWEAQRTPRPPGAVPGLLTAMQHVMVAARTDPRTLKTLKPIVYFYNHSLYDLSIRGVDWMGRTRIGTRTFDRLIRTDFVVRNWTTGEISRFGVTYSPDPASSLLPVQIFYQPGFWLRVELRLDDDADAPADPASDDSVLTRIRAICASAER